METSDSSIHTLKHIETIGKYIDIIAKDISNSNNFIDNIDGDIYKGIDINAKRFGYDSVLTKVFQNTADKVFHK